MWNSLGFTLDGYCDTFEMMIESADLIEMVA
jgi:hypothetical protein